MIRKTTTRAGIAAAAALFILAACGSDDKEASTATTSAQASTVPQVTIDASAPATVPAGQPVPVTVAVVGLSLIKADGDTSGRTGHLHLFVDQDPTAAGQPIPTGQPGIIHSAETTIAVPDLAPGEHTIWVVAGNGAHVPLDPKVMDKVTVTVG